MPSVYIRYRNLISAMSAGLQSNFLFHCLLFTLVPDVGICCQLKQIN